MGGLARHMFKQNLEKIAEGLNNIAEAIRSGVEPGVVTCPDCKGSGKGSKLQTNGLGMVREIPTDKDCDRCFGQGFLKIKREDLREM